MINVNEEKPGRGKDFREILCTNFPKRLDFEEIFDIMGGIENDW